MKTGKTAATVMWLFFCVALCAGCNAEQANAADPAVTPTASGEVVLVPQATAADVASGRVFTMDLTDDKKVFVFAGSPLAAAYKNVQIICPNGTVMAMTTWAPMQGYLGIPSLMDPTYDDPLVISGAEPKKAAKIFAELPAQSEAKLLQCPCEMKCQTCNDGATVCSDAACECAG